MEVSHNLQSLRENSSISVVRRCRTHLANIVMKNRGLLQ